MAAPPPLDGPPVVERIAGLAVVRGDLIPGGTKRLILREMLADLPDTDFAYAGTVFGHGALALALACRDLGKTAHLYINAPKGGHPMLDRLRETGMPLSVHAGETMSRLHALAASDGLGAVLPPGFDTPAFRSAAARALRGTDLSGIKTIWTAAVSGAMVRALQAAFPEKAFVAVRVAKGACDLGTADTRVAPEKYHRPARNPPPYPACPYTDAKVWRFVADGAPPGSLVWTVAA